jgi:hypothetical protein
MLRLRLRLRLGLLEGLLRHIRSPNAEKKKKPQTPHYLGQLRLGQLRLRRLQLQLQLRATSRPTGLSVGRSGSATPSLSLVKRNPALDSEPTTSPSSLHLVYSCEQPNKASLGRAEKRVVVRKPCPFSLSPQARGTHLQHAFQ